MSGSFIDMLPPEAQHVLGGIAVLVIAAGFVIWMAGIKIARFSVAMLMGAIFAALGAWLLPRLTGVEPITGGLLGFVAGALAGAVGFRILQGLVLASCFGLAVGGMYYRWHIAPELRSTITATAAVNDHVQLPMSELLIPTDRLRAASAATPKSGDSAKRPPAAPASNGLVTFGQSLLARWNAIPKIHQRRLLIVSIGSAAVALLIAFGFARQTTWVISALIGALLLIAGVNALVHVYAPQYETYMPGDMRSRYLVLGVLTLIGMIIQYRLFWPRRRKAAGADASAAPAGGAAPVPA